jgi:putative colanic acid biosynthesis glycosyltransferase
MVTLSIVSVTFRDDEGLVRTKESLCSFAAAGASVEWIVVDGAASESTKAILIDAPVPVVLISEQDEGIYDGMNKGIERARGSWLWFLNGGDESVVASTDSFIQFLGSEIREDLLAYSYEIASGSRLIHRRARHAGYLMHALPASHQAILYRREPVVDCGGYNLGFSVSGDYELTARLWKQGYRMRRMPLPIARFWLGGLSSQRERQIAEDANRVQTEVLQLPRAFVACSRLLHAAARLRRQLNRRRSLT